MIAQTAVELPDPTLTPAERVILDTHPVELTIRATDAENECEHGNLPFDRDPDCECWTRSQTAALLGQAPLDDGSPGLDRAAAFDLRIPASRKGRHEMAEIHDQEVHMQQSSNGTAHFPTAQELHEWYMDDDARTLQDVSDHFHLSKSTVVRRFELAELECKPRGGRRASSEEAGPTAPPEIQAPVPETPIDGIAVAVVSLERKRTQLAEELERLDSAIETVRGLAA